MPLRGSTFDESLSFSSSFSAFFEDDDEDDLNSINMSQAKTFMTDQRATTFLASALCVPGVLVIRFSEVHATNSLGSVMYPVNAEAAAVAGLAK